MNARPYQIDCIDGVEAAFREHDTALAVLPTGAGKSLIFSWLAKRLWDSQRKRTMILAHRDELIEQAIDKLHRATGIRASKEKADSYALKESPVVVGSIQSLMRTPRLNRWPADHFGMVVVDEAHHSVSASYQSILKHFDPYAKILGVTASAQRSDKKELGNYFKHLAFEVRLWDLIAQGYLSPIQIKSIPLEIDVSHVKTTAGDFDKDELGSALEPYLPKIAEALAVHAAGRRTLAFLPLIATSKKFVAACCAAGINARHIDGTSEDRKEILEDFASEKFNLLSNAMLLTEGYDDSGIDCVVVLRPTKSQPLFQQMCGRGTRIDILKTDLLIVDFLWLSSRLRLCRPANLIAASEVEAEIITRLSQESGRGDDLQALATTATAEREQKLAQQLAEQAAKKAEFLSADEFAARHASVSTLEQESFLSWELEPVTGLQKAKLKRFKIDSDTVRDFGHASRILETAQRTAPLQMASPKVASLMRRMSRVCRAIGIYDLSQPTAADGGRFFQELKRRKVTQYA